MSHWGGDWVAAAYFGFAGVIALALGMRVGATFTRTDDFNERVAGNARAWSMDDIFRLGFVVIAVAYVFAMLVPFAGPARQPFEQAANVKYLGLFMITYASLLTGRRYGIVTVLIGIEIVFGMTGFFAEFKFTVLTLLVAAIMARPRLRSSDLAVVGAAAGVLLSVAVFWSAVKADYRLFVNAGSGAQVIRVSLSERLVYLADAAISVDGFTVTDGFDRLVRRHGYLEFLALTMDHVPAVRSHEYGAMTWAAISHILMPRVLFPNKPPLPHDTDIMIKYTGLPPLWNRNTSISLGNFTEMYIDFGFIGAFFVQFSLGAMIGFAVSNVINFSRCPPLISAGLCVMIVLPVAYFGTALPKLVGSLAYACLIAILGQRTAIPELLAWLGPNRRKRTQ